MKHFLPIAIALFSVAVCCSAPDPSFEREQSFRKVYGRFEEPGAEFRPAPFWVWNGKVTREDVDRMLPEFKKQGFGGVFIHPRPGMETVYLSEDWFDLWRYSLEKGKELGLEVWIYDENSYPSGFAGGHVQSEWPESYDHATELVPTVTEVLPEDLSPYSICLRQEGESFVDITGEPRTDAPGRYFLYQEKKPEAQRWLGGFPYVDLLYPGTTEHFIDITMRGYEQRFGADLGGTIKGVFTDEPHWQRWTPGLFEAFESDWGYDLRTHLPMLKEEIGNWKQVRYHHLSTKLRLFVEHWSKPWNAYCRERGLIWTGHYWEHEWPNMKRSADNMAMYAWHQMPGIDMLYNRYDSISPRAQFGNVRSVKEVRSVANQIGQTRILCESYGGGGWDETFEDFKRLGDWEYALGVNFMCQHFSPVTIEGVRKFDYPDYFYPYSPWWEDYGVLNDHFARLSLVLSQGEQRNDVLLLEPNSTLWMYYTHRYSHQALADISGNFQSLVTRLNAEQVEFDLGSETILRDYGSVKDGKLIVGERAYSTVIVPEMCENLFASTAALLEPFVSGGGKLVALSEPEMEDAFPSDRLKALWENPAVLREMPGLDSGYIRFLQMEGGDLQHQRREYADGQLLFLANSSRTEHARGRIRLRGESLLSLDTFSGTVSRRNGVSGDSGFVEFDYDIPPAGHLLYFAPSRRGAFRSVPDEGVSSEEGPVLEAESPLSVTPVQDNVLTLLFCDLTVDGKTEKDLYVPEACKELYAHFGLDNPWEKRVQYGEDIISCDTLHTGDITVAYRFRVAEETDCTGMKLVAEKPYLWQVSINGHSVSPIEGEHPLDARNAAYLIGEYVRPGENIVTLQRSPMSIYAEISFAFLTGNFSVIPDERNGWQIAPACRMDLGDWTSQGYPFYAWGVSYKKTYDIPESGARVLRLGAWTGTVCEVYVDGKKAGVILTHPGRLDLTDRLPEGRHEVEVRCIGSLSNLYGPHFKPRSGKMNPGSWYLTPPPRPVPAASYIFDSYGLKEDFSLSQSASSGTAPLRSRCSKSF